MPCRNADTIVEAQLHRLVRIFSASIADLALSVVSACIDNTINEEKGVILATSNRHDVLALENCKFGWCANSIKVLEGLQIESKLAVIRITTAKQRLIFGDEKCVATTSTDVYNKIFDWHKHGRILLKLARGLGRAKRAIERLPPTIRLPILAQRHSMRIPSSDFLDVADSVDESWHVHRSEFLVPEAKLAVDVAAHGVNIAAIFRR